MAEGATGGLSEERTVERITPDDLPLVYANNVALASSLWDFTMDFGVILEATEASLKFRDLVRVVMSPQHARAFSEVLADHIRQYEQIFGRIPHPVEDDKGGERPPGK